MDGGGNSFDSGCLSELLPIYYKKLFPFGTLCRWMSYGDATKSYLRNREFSFTLEGDIYVRYRSYNDQSSMEKEIIERCPHKIDIGAVYSCQPSRKDLAPAGTFAPQEKELVFDIDMTDYDEVRNCCSGADICPRCWTLMVMAIKIMDACLRDDFGFKHLLWVYSGRRGVHCWVGDKVARQLGTMGRSAVAEYLSVVKGGANMGKKVTLYEGNVHPSIQRALGIIQERFDDYAVEAQDFLGDEDRVKRVLALLPDKDLQDQLLKPLMELPNSKSRWCVLKESLTTLIGDKFRKSRTALNEIVLQYAYPRLDVNVSTGLNHLLKSPFCIHPKTGRACVPIDPERVDEFDPFKVPTLTQLIDELSTWTRGSGENSADSEAGTSSTCRLLDYKKTSLRPYVKTFEDFVDRLEADRKASETKDVGTALGERTNW